MKEELVGMKLEPFHPPPTKAIQPHVTWGGGLRGGCSGTLAMPHMIPVRARAEVPQIPHSLNSELGGQQEPLSLDYANVTLGQESPPWACSVMGDGAAPTAIQEGLSEKSHLSLAERHVFQPNEQLVQEVQA